MGILLGLPLRLFALVFVLIRFFFPLALILLLVWLWRHRQGKTRQRPGGKKSGPDFKGPVYTVEYEEVKDEEGQRRD